MENQNDGEHIVNFELCKECKYYGLKEDQEPCNDCLNQPVNQWSYKPVHFEEDKEDEE